MITLLVYINLSKKKINKILDIFNRGTGKGDNQKISKEVGVPLCEALVAYDAGDFAKAVSLVQPIRYKIITIGGSHAQVINTTTIQSQEHFTLGQRKYYSMKIYPEG